MRAQALAAMSAIGLLAACAMPLSEALEASAPRTTGQAPVSWAIFVDDLHLDFRNTGRFRDFLRQIDRNLIAEGDSVAMSASGPSGMAIDFTTDRQKLTNSIKMASGNALRLSDIVRIVDDPVSPSEVMYRAGTALIRAQRLMSRLAQRTDATPKAFVYISNGYDVDFLSSDALRRESRRGEVPRVSVADLREMRTALATLARQSGIHVFVIDPRLFPGSADLDDPIDPERARRHLATTHASLRELADSTGGLALLERDSTAERFARINSVLRR